MQMKKFLRGAGILLLAISVIMGGNALYKDKQADARSTQRVSALKNRMTAPEGGTSSADVSAEDASSKGDGEEFAGILLIPALEKELPVASSFSYDILKDYPCLYGQEYLEPGRLLIAAHSYKSQFGDIGKLKPGSQISFIDLSGETNGYTVTKVEVLGGSDVEKMLSGDWDLTLFTCNLFSNKRITVRCSLINDIRIEKPESAPGSALAPEIRSDIAK